MPQENLNKIYNAGKFFEQKPEPEQTPKPETKLSTVKRKINVAKAFVPQQEDPFKKKVEAVLKGIEPASAPATAGKEEKPASADAEVIVGTGQDYIGKNLVAEKKIRVEGDAGDDTGLLMSGGKIHIEGNAGDWTGKHMSDGEIYVEGNARGYTGRSMSGGEIHVEGHAGGWTGCAMSGGILRIDGDVAFFDRTAFSSNNKGTIIWKKQTIWENGKKAEPGWTNLKVEEKIHK